MCKLAIFVLLASLACASCLPAMIPGGSSAPNPDASAEDTTGSRIKAGVSWLWACVVALKARGVAHEALSELRATIIDISRLAAEGSVSAALALFDRARDLAASLKEGV